ncbi:UNVERIFIED_CONTAM: hypothetical protein Slati_0512400 [Sesamum latifolium]|uniref:Uncharacterized protein n=1 Tax=Sesamum latifolium TaxID=2727402 RepID=A0AAW2Y023_9LAMI
MRAGAIDAICSHMAIVIIYCMVSSSPRDIPPEEVSKEVLSYGGSVRRLAGLEDLGAAAPLARGRGAPGTT